MTTTSRFEKLALVILPLALLALIATYFINPFHARSIDPRARVLGFVPYRIPSRSMLPTLPEGAIFVANLRALADRDPRRGEIVVFKYPPDPSVTYVKRVIAVGGEVIAVHEGQAYVDGKLLSEPYLPAQPIDPYPADDFPPTRIPPGEFFVMGDNRNNSADSRLWGTVPRALIMGTVTSRIL